MAGFKQTDPLNGVIGNYFNSNPGEIKVPAKDLMSGVIKAGIFPIDYRGGLAIRNILRQLDRAGQLQLIPHAHPGRKLQNTDWYSVRLDGNGPDTLRLTVPAVTSTSRVRKKRQSRKQSDENYVIDICYNILGEQSLRQHRFDFLRGDTGTKLPIDAFYPEHNLVIEYKERQHSEPVKHFDKPHVITASGVHRGEQRTIYDQRRRTVLAEQKIKLIPYTLCTYDSSIVRSPRDIEIVRTFIKTQIQERSQ